MILLFEWMARLILVGLIGLSVWSVKIMLERKKFFQANDIPLDKLLSLLKLGKIKEYDDEIQKINPSFAKSVSEIKDIDLVDERDQIFQVYIQKYRNLASQGLPVLGSLGSTTPFIGLLGTVMGIIVSFGKLAENGGGTNAVMFSLAEALILTAVGLIVAIPSVVAFNYFNRKSKKLIEQLITLKNSYLIYRKRV